MGPIRSKIGEIRTKIGPFWVLSFMKIPLVSPSLDQKEQNCFGHPQFYSSIAPMLRCFENVQTRVSNYSVVVLFLVCYKVILNPAEIFLWYLFIALGKRHH